MFAHEQAANSIEHAKEVSRTRYFWWVNYLTDYTDFDFLWEPVPWEADQTHVWPSQHQDNSGTMLVPKHGGPNKNYNHTQLSRNISVSIIGIDHGTGLTVNCNITTRFISDYLGTLRRVLSKISDEYVWVISSVCDYTNFDFTWHPSEWQADMLHVFPSNEQKFGDTFYIHVPSFLQKTENLKILEWFETLNFIEDTIVPRIIPPAIKYHADTVVNAIWNYEFKEPIIQVYRHTPSIIIPTINLWQESTRVVLPISADSSAAMIPRECKNYIKTQLYDYPYINKAHQQLLPGQQQDIIFISYDEGEANANYAKLIDRFPRAHRVHGIKGMENALAAAAAASTTPWYFAVFGKTELYPTFDFSFQPDYFQQPKHYIFYSENRVNKLVYGEMAVIMYNCQLILDNRDQEFGLDYTTSFPHEVIPILSTYGNFDTSPYQTWRTAFREVSKLYDIQDRTPTIDTEYRIHIWETVANGPYAEWAIKGAADGREFFLKFKDDFDYRKNSFDWQWLRSYFLDRYPPVE